MIWKKFTIETTVEAEDLVAEYLEELGFPGAEIEDQLPLTEEEMKQMYVDVPLIPEEETEKANVSIYLDDSYDPGQIRELQDKVAEELERMRSYISVGSGTITVTETEDDATWQENWKQYYRPFRLGEDIVICPTWTE
jgi:ribosomal protein L11 methyltransferase